MEWISILRCPLTKNSLVLLQPDEISLLNQKILSGKVLQINGKPLSIKIEQGLRCINNAYAYPVIDGIMLLLKDFAIPWQQDGDVTTSLDADKQWVRDFYDSKGWQMDKEGNYEDAVIYEDLRKVSGEYISKCHQRVSRHIHPSGQYLLDAASGPVQYAAYLAYSDNYRYRICVDFSFQALKEARKKLGSKAICVLCDITRLPFKKNSIDSFISLHTIYHIPKDEQARAIRELYRVLMPKGKGVVVYDWFKHSVWMNTGLLPFRAFTFIRNRVTRTLGKIAQSNTSTGRLYFHAHRLDYLKKNLPPFQLKVWRSLSVPFLRTYIHPWLFGRQILHKIYEKEEKDPEECGRKGEYPMLVFEKPEENSY